ncbi:MAG TPA: DUF2507 domain-containing protein [Candidatus Avamphibacillus intestinigallinarum]|nr:DUF2507 domain-containing protein [Candidatus Avamphibacillus intestinigallinarum]
MSLLTEDNQQPYAIDLFDNLHTNGAGYDILRYLALPELFGDERDTLLYFTGRKLARHFAMETLNDLYEAFEKLGWGKLEMTKEKRKELTFSLMSDSVVQRLEAPFPIEFRLESGFIAEAIEMIFDAGTECVEEIHEKIRQVEFTVVYTA